MYLLTATPGWLLEGLRKVEQEHVRTGANKEQLWRMYTSGISVQEQCEVGEGVQEEGGAYARRKIAPRVCRRGGGAPQAVPGEAGAGAVS